MRNTVILSLALACAAPLATLAEEPYATGAAVKSSEPGKAAIAQAVKITAAVQAIDKATRTVTLKGPQGNLVDVVAGKEVRNFDQIRVGDQVVVEYIQALSLELKKTTGPLERKEVTDAARAEPGQKPGAIAGRKVTVMTDVIAVDPVKSTITLKGPEGHVVELNVQNKDHFKVVKVGDQVEAIYVEAAAISVEPMAKSGGK